MNRETGKHVAGGNAKKPREKKPKKPSRLTRQQKILIVVAVLLALVLAVVVACQSLFVKPDLETKKPETEEEELDYGDGVRPRSDGERKSEDFYTVLILGRDTGGGGNTDTMLLASYDVTNQKATVMSIPRDTMVNVNWDVKKINSVYNMNGGGDKGIKALYQEISQLVGFEPDYQVVVEWEAVGEIVDAMGGVYFDVPRDMDYEDPYQDLSIPYKGVSAWSRYYQQNLSYVVPVADELLELVNNELSPFKEVFTLSDLDIMYVNSDGSIGSTTGHVEDSKAAKPPVKNSGSSTTTTTPDPDTETVTDPNGTVTTPETGETGSETGNQGSTGTGDQTGGETGSQTGNEGGTQTGDPSGETGSETGNEGNAQTGSESGSESGAQTGGETGSGESTSPEVPSEPDISIIEPAPTE